MRRAVVAILAGVTVSTVLVGMLVFPLMAAVQEVIARLLPAAVSDAAYGLTVDVVTAAPLVTPGIVLAVLLARRRDHPPGHCRQCGYNLRGNTSGRCPECGASSPRRRISGADNGDQP